MLYDHDGGNLVNSPLGPQVSETKHSEIMLSSFSALARGPLCAAALLKAAGN